MKEQDILGNNEQWANDPNFIQDISQKLKVKRNAGAVAQSYNFNTIQESLDYNGAQQYN